MGLTIVQVDAFTSTPYAGNPAAVCVLPMARDERWMQDVAREMNLSETAFLLAEDDGYRLRWARLRAGAVAASSITCWRSSRKRPYARSHPTSPRSNGWRRAA